MKFDHLDLSALGVTYVLFHHTPHFLTHHRKPCFSFLEEKVSSILITQIISFARAAFPDITRCKILPSAFPWKISCCYCCLPASVCFSREWNSFLIFFPHKLFFFFAGPSLSTVYTHLYSLQFLHISSPAKCEVSLAKKLWRKILPIPVL